MLTHLSEYSAKNQITALQSAFFDVVIRGTFIKHYTQFEFWYFHEYIFKVLLL